MNQTVVKQLSGSCQAVVRQLSGSCQAIVIVFRHMSGNSFEQLQHKQLD